MAWGIWNKIKNGLKKAGKWIKNKIIKPVGKVVGQVVNKVVKPVAETISNIPLIEKLPGPAGTIGKVAKGITTLTPLTKNIFK